MNLLDFIKFCPDSRMYIAYADMIIKGGEWLDKVDLSTLDITLFRMPLYPLLIALFKMLFGNGWPYGLIAFQLVLLFCSALLVYELCAYLEFKKINMWTAVVGYLTGLPLLYSFFILTDAIYSTLGISVICALCLRIAKKSTDIKYNVVLVISLFLMGFLRETSLYFVLTLLPIMLINLIYKEYKKVIKTLLVCLLPVILAQEAMRQWNNYRCGERILTCGTANALLAPQLDLLNNQPLALEYSSIKSYLPESRPLTFSDGTSAVSNLMKKEQLSVLQIMSMLEGDYYKLLMLFPKDQFDLVIYRLSRDILFVLNPIFTITELIDPDGIKLPRFSKMEECFKDNTNFGGLIFIFVFNGLRLFSFLFCLFGFYKFTQRIVCRCFNTKTLLVGGMLFHGFSWIFIFSIFHMEIRYIITSVVVFLLTACMPGLKLKHNEKEAIFSKV